MLQFYLLPFTHTMLDLKDIENISAKKGGRPLTPQDFGALEQHLRVLLYHCDRHAMDSATKKLLRFVNSMFVGDPVNNIRAIVTYAQTHEALKDIRERIFDDLSATNLFLHVQPERVQFCNDWWLEDVVPLPTSFPQALKELRESARCFALGEDIASVFHAMRSLEVVLSALAGRLGVAFDRRQWGNIIDDLEAKIRTINGPQWGANWRNEQEFYSGAALQFRWFKDAWRNHTMHVRANYDANAAAQVLDHVREFIEHLAKGGLKE